MSAKEAEDFQKDLGAAPICPKPSKERRLPSEDIWCGTQQSLSESTGETQNLELIQTPIVVYFTPSNLTKIIYF